MTERRAHRVALLILAAVLGWLQAPSVLAQPRLYAQVVDRETGALVTDLQAADVVVREDGVVRDVIDVRPANLPLKLVVVVDNSVRTRRAFDVVKSGLRRFFSELPPNQDMSLLWLSPEPGWAAREVFDRSAIAAMVNDVDSQRTAPARLLDGLVEAGEWLATPGLSRPVMVVVAGDGRDASPALEARLGDIVDIVSQHGVTVHTVVLLTPWSSAIENRTSLGEALGRDLRTLSGGSFTAVLRGPSLWGPLSEILERIRARTRELSRQYLIRYGRPDTAAPERVDVDVTRLGVRYTVTPDGRLP